MDSINELKIDLEFAEKIPPLTPEEYEQLEANSEMKKERFWDKTEQSIGRISFEESARGRNCRQQ